MPAVVTTHPSAAVVPLSRFELHDIETVRLVLRGSSVVDWVRLNFRSDAEIDAFLRVNGFDPEQPDDVARIRALQFKAMSYLQDHLRYRIPEVVRNTSDVRDLFRFASQSKGRRVYRFYACMTLKVMHIIHHVEAHELLSKLTMSDAEVAVMVQARIEHVVRGLLERGFPIVEFFGNRKTPFSVYSKLLAKKSTQAAAVLDKLRFRLVTQRIDDIPPLVLALTRELLPFAYIMPAQTHNSVIDLHRQLRRSGNIMTYRIDGREVPANEPPVTDYVDEQRNEFSGPDYRILNFVSDVPLRADRLMPEHTALYREFGPVVFGSVEFQIVDKVTIEINQE